MADVETLKSLRERVLAASGADRELDDQIVIAFGWRRGFHGAEQHNCWYDEAGKVHTSPSRVTGSIDAALALVERMLPGWRWEKSDDMILLSWWNPKKRQFEIVDEEGAIVPLSILAALLSALIAIEEQGAR